MKEKERVLRVEELQYKVKCEHCRCAECLKGLVERESWAAWAAHKSAPIPKMPLLSSIRFKKPALHAFISQIMP